MAQISFDYNNCINNAKNLETISSTMQSQSCKEIEEIIKNIEASWSGDSAKLFIQYLNHVMEHLKKQATYLNQCSDYLRTSANKMKQAEQNANSAAKKI